jgi:hypothetical protein
MTLVDCVNSSGVSPYSQRAILKIRSSLEFIHILLQKRVVEGCRVIRDVSDEIGSTKDL